MFNFHQPKMDDFDFIKATLDKSQPESCEYALSNLIGWSSYYGAEIAEIEGCLVAKIKNNDLFGFPKGDNWKKALLKLRSEYEFASFYGLTNTEKEKLEAIFPGEYNFYPSRNSFDYIYRVTDLAELSGKKYHPKRNHIAYFKKNYEWSYEEISADNLNECIEMNEKWYELNFDKDPDGIKAEREVLNIAFENFEKFGFLGGLLRVNGEVVAFTFGEKLNDNTFVTHFEKAFSSIRGAYPMINSLFAINTISGFEFVNREDDLGSEGLRKAKLSYYPEILLEKFTAVKI